MVLRKYKRAEDQIDLSAVADDTPGFSGAELEAVITGALYRAFHAGRDLQTEDCLEERKHVTPVSVTMKERIDDLRSWASTRTQPAGLLAEEAVAITETPRTYADARVGAVKYEPRKALAKFKKPTIN